MKLIYNTLNGEIMGVLSKNQNAQMFFSDYKNKNYFVELKCDNIPCNFSDYKVIKNTLVKRSEQELEELRRYHRVLTDSERLLNKLKPSHEEIQKAQNTIEILTLIQEVF